MKLQEVTNYCPTANYLLNTIHFFCLTHWEGSVMYLTTLPTRVDMFCKECKTKVLIKEKQENIIGHLKNCLVHNLLQLVLFQVWPNHHLQNLEKRMKSYIFYTAVDRWCCIRWSKLIFPGLTHPSFSKHFRKIKLILSTQTIYLQILRRQSCWHSPTLYSSLLQMSPSPSMS